MLLFCFKDEHAYINADVTMWVMPNVALVKIAQHAVMHHSLYGDVIDKAIGICGTPKALIALALYKKFRPVSVERIVGPSGLLNLYTVQMLEDDSIYSLTVSYGGSTDIFLVNTKTNTDEYAPGTIGALNNMNRPTVCISEVTTGEALAFLEKVEAA